MKKIWQIVLTLITILLVWFVLTTQTAGPKGSAVVMSQANAGLQEQRIDDQYRSTYEIFVYSFYDTDNDGIGDLKGVDQKLDYIEGLGFNQIWLMPVSPSPTYHKYDVTDYMEIDPEYGTMQDFDQLLKDCHERGINVIIDLVLNHTSSQHPWFLEACDYLRSLPAGGMPDPAVCPYVQYYRFDRERQNGYTPLSGTDWYYEARFWDQMPDLNLDEPMVRDEIAKIIAFWFDRGVDGFRLDAVTSYYTGNDEKNIEFLSWLNDTVDTCAPGKYIVCEGWDAQGKYAQYYASGVDSMFDFAFAGPDGVIANTLKGKYTARDFGNALEKEWQLYESYDPDAVNAPFYTNHDMARGAGYYAGDDGSKTKLALAMNLLTSGNAFLYYGEELGMKGSGKDENKRAPMYWSDSDTDGMTHGPKDMDSFAMKFPSLEDQIEDPYSIYNYVKEILRIRNALPVIARGRTWVHQDLTTDHVCMIMKEDGEHAPAAILMNLSDTEETVDVSSTEFHHLLGVLTVNDQGVTFKNDTLVLPPYAVAVLGE